LEYQHYLPEKRDDMVFSPRKVFYVLFSIGRMLGTTAKKSYNPGDRERRATETLRHWKSEEPTG
jgi:hypothetical protein